MRFCEVECYEWYPVYTLGEPYTPEDMEEFGTDDVMKVDDDFYRRYKRVMTEFRMLQSELEREY